MATQALQFSPSAFRSHLIALWDRVLRIGRRPPKTLRLCQSLPLGERRFVAVVQFEKARFLVGGTSSSLVLLSRLADSGGRAEDDTEGENLRPAEQKPTTNRGGEHQGDEHRRDEQC